MLRCQLVRIRAAAALALFAPASLVCAATPTTNATGAATILRPVSVIKLKDMDFGYVTSAAAGTVVPLGPSRIEPRRGDCYFA